MPDPLVFISHKHSDTAIAEKIASFIEAEAHTPIRVFLSSNPRFEGPKFGQHINREICKALWETDVLILIYTTEEDRDWSWCMWECGVAIDQSSPGTTMIVFQCGSEKPKIFEGTRVVDVRKIEELQGFVRQYFTDTGFFPSIKKALAPGFTKEITDKKALALYNNMKEVLPEFVPPRQWSTWPYVRVQLPTLLVDRIKDVNTPMLESDRIKAVKESTTITTIDARALEVFGRANLDPSIPFASLARIWEASFPGKKAEWFGNCCEQIMLAAAEKLLRIRSVAIRQVGSDTEFVPIVTRVRRTASVVEFDVHLFDVPSRGGESVSSKMLTLDRFYWKRLDAIQPAETRLRALSDELKQQGRNRLPLLDRANMAKFIIHRSKIDEFIVENLDRANTLTLQDLLDDSKMRSMFENTFAVVGNEATLDEAKSAMRRIPDCRDVFVTSTGSADEPVLGWLTNVDVEGEPMGS